jgi:hypothetical protein
LDAAADRPPLHLLPRRGLYEAHVDRIAAAHSRADEPVVVNPLFALVAHRSEPAGGHFGGTPGVASLDLILGTDELPIKTAL